MAGKPIDLTALFEAINDRNIAEVQRQLKTQPDVNQLLAGKSPLVKAARKGFEFVTALLDAGADANGRDAEGVTPLYTAAELGDARSVEALLNSGANPDAMIGTVKNALRVAVRTRSPRHLEVLKVLIGRGANVNALSLTKSGEPAATALIEACRVGNIEAVRALLASGADINAVVYTGTALTCAAESGHESIVKLLQESGADSTIPVPGERGSDDTAGKTAAELAAAAGYQKIASMLSQDKGEIARSGDDIAEAWKRLEAALARNNPAAMKTLRPGAKAKEIAGLTSAIENQLSPDVARFFEIHNGQAGEPGAPFIKAGGPLYAKFRLLPIPDIIEEWRMWRKLLLGGDFKGQSVLSDGGVRREWFNSGWIPISADGLGNAHCIDLSPATGGKVGQIILLWHDEQSRPLVARSLTEWLDDLAAAT